MFAHDSREGVSGLVKRAKDPDPHGSKTFNWICIQIRYDMTEWDMESIVIIITALDSGFQ